MPVELVRPDNRAYGHNQETMLEAFAARDSTSRLRGRNPKVGHHNLERKVRPLSVTTRTAVLLDRHPLWLDAVEQVLNRIDIDVLAKSTTTEQAVTLLEEQQPDLLVAEIEDEDGELTVTTWLREVRDRFPKLKVIVLSSHDEPSQIDGAFAAGAVAYVIKTAHPEDVCAAVRQAFEHSIYLPGASASGSSRAVATGADVVASAADSAVLTRRELEILQLVAEGHSNAQVGRMLWVTEQTVKFHLSNIYRKLDVSNRTEASRWAQTRNLLPAATAGEAATAR